jgi:DNA-binding beta-propeller fold protein YncE
LFFNDKISTNIEYRQFLIGKRYRYSTTGAVGWFTKNNSNFLITANFSDQKINLLKFNEENNTIKLIQKIETIKGLPELSDVSNKENLYAISCSTNKIYIYKILENVHLKLLKHFLLNDDAGYIHGISFSPDTKFLACTFIGKNENQYIKIYGLKVPFLFINLITKKKTLSSKPIFFSDSLELSNPDDLAFYPDGSHTFISNQGNDKVYVFEFDQETGQLGKNIFTLSNTAAELSFPHGIAISFNGKYLAVTNYGN